MDDDFYQVVGGDTLYSIAKKYNTTVDEIKKMNNLSSNMITIGDKLMIPKAVSLNTYTVKKGDTLYSIARKFNTTVTALMLANELTTDKLSIGQELIVN